MNTLTGTDLKKAATILRSGGLVAIPTETVYGLAGNALDEKAVLSIFKVKNRPLGNPLIIHLHDQGQLVNYVSEIPQVASELMKVFSPGPLTYLLKKTPQISDLITAGSPYVAIRFPAHPLTQSLLQKIDFPLAAPSANKYTMVSPTMPEHVFKQFRNEIPYILDGGSCKKGIESTVVGFENDEVIIYRNGMISEEKLIQQGFTVRYAEKSNGPVHSPGLSALHYSPRTPLLICNDLKKSISRYQARKIAVISFSDRFDSVPTERQFILSESGDAEEAAGKLYAALHLMDESGAELILIELVPATGIGKAINDRILRAGKNEV
jgi:L-threonylcarbamoyladenylate synthase